MKKLLMRRRQFISGAGGFTLGVPFLRSLVPIAAYAAEVTPPLQKRFVAVMTDHGGVYQSNMFPPDAMAPNVKNLFPGFDMHYGNLEAKIEGADTVLSPVLRAPTTVFPTSLVAKMNVVQGLCIPFYIAHNTGGHLGNYARNDGNGGEGSYAQQFPMPTIDQLMAYAPGFYTQLSSVRERTIATGSRGGFSFYWSNTTTKSGNIQGIRSEYDPQALFDSTVGQVQQPSSPVPTRKSIVDKVRANYRSLRESNRRLSVEDKQRLDDHIARLNELERKLAAMASSAKSCGTAKRPGSVNTNSSRPADLKLRFQAYNDVIVAAFLCGTSGIATIGAAAPLVDFSGSWHQDTAHMWQQADAQTRLVQHNRNVFEWIYADLARKLDAVEDFAGRTYLDNTLMAWSQESGMSTHDNANMPLILAGSAGGYFKTGQFLDYRCKTPAQRFGSATSPSVLYYGLTWNQWLATALQAMGLAPAEFERNNVPGYGLNLQDPNLKSFKLNPGAFSSASQPLPLLKA
ncbi:MAG: DUF1552 domain-containing protein [Deltaproteobacteria bacterium]|nr:DUF1552 domain-containing protein [Deltaproteobacteria bacterium]